MKNTATDAANNVSSITRTVTVTPRPFITTWKTDNTGTTQDNQIKIGTRGSGYNYQINWGDGKSDSGVTGDITHSYDVAGTYRVSITGDFPQIYFNYQDRHKEYDNEKIMTIEQWGDIQWQSMHQAFYRCYNITGKANDVPDLSSVNDMSSMFRHAHSFNQNIGNWDVSNVTNMSNMFLAAWMFNQDIGNWSVSNVTNMRGMFGTGPIGIFGSLIKANPFNQDIGNWDVSNVTNMSDMFTGSVFNQDIGNWDVSKVTNMRYMFSAYWNQPSLFNQDISRWNVSSVIEMSNMFNGAEPFNHNLSSWNVSSVTNMSRMFYDAESFNHNLSSWNVSSVTNMRRMFYNANTFNQNIGDWNVAEVTDMTEMVSGTNLSTANYDALLTGWSTQVLQNSVPFSAGTTKYSASSQAARDALTGTFNWTVTDGGVLIQ